jgi:ERCC4-related helicase
METGKGKTYISIMLMNYLFGQYSDRKKKVVFLVCEGSLVEQQYLVIKNNTKLRIRQFMGGKMSSLLSEPKIFRRVWDENDVFISTPQIINKVLTIGYLTFTEIDLLIFDECHHTDKDHPYNVLMNEYYFFYKTMGAEKFPQILGLTASPLKKKIDSDVQNTAHESLINLAENLDCEFVIDPDLYALNQGSNIDSTQTQKEAEKEYVLVKCHLECDEYEEASNYLYMNLFSKLIELCFSYNYEFFDYKHHYEEYVRFKLKSQDLLEFNQILCRFKYLYEFRKTSFLFGVLEQIQRQVFMLLENVNFEAVEDLIKQYFRLYENNKKDLLNDIIQTKEFKDLNKSSIEALIDILRKFTIGKIKYESNRLTRLLKQVGYIAKNDAKQGELNPSYEGHRIIIFVCNRVVSEYLCKLVNKHLTQEVNNMVTYKKFLCVNVVGINSKSTRNGFNSKNSISNLNKNLDKFKKGEAQILIGTSTIEEGLDVKQCDVVIVYTDLRTAKSYIQMKGRARKENAKFVMYTHDQERTQEYIENFVSLIKVMRQAFSDSIVGDFRRMNYIESRKLKYPYFFVPSTHAKLTLKNVSVIFNEIKTQFNCRRIHFNYNIDFEPDSVHKIPTYRAIMQIEPNKDLHPALYHRPIISESYPDKNSATHHCMLYFMALCHRNCVVDDYFRLC